MSLVLLAVVAVSPRVRAQEQGFDVSAELVHGAYHVAGVPNVIVHAPPGFDARAPLSLVVFLHGFSCCVPVLMAAAEAPCRDGDSLHEGWDLGRFHDAAHTNTLLVVPQLAFMKRDGRPGAFGRDGGFRAFIEELLSGPLAQKLGAARALRDVASIDLIVHSGGYHTALAILEHGSLPPRLIRNVVLFDALYGETPRFADYVEHHASEGLHFVVVSLPNGTTSRESAILLRRLRQTLGADAVVTAKPEGLSDAVSQHAIVIGEATPPHRLVPATHLAEVLRALHGSHAQSADRAHPKIETRSP